MKAIRAAGFTFDSSIASGQQLHSGLPSLSVSWLNGVAASDYEWFQQKNMSTADAQAWLIRLYEEDKRLGRVTNVLLHPSIIEPHIEALREFVAYAKSDGATFLSYDAYLDRLNKPIAHIGAWVELYWAEYTPARIVEDAKRLGLTDVYLAAVSPEGEPYYGPSNAGEDRFGEAVAALRAAGFKVHAWLPALKNDRLAKERPQWAMHRIGSSEPSRGWLSPHRKEVRAHVAETAAHLVRTYDIDGVNLDYIRYPASDYDFGTAALAAFEAEADDPARKRPFADWGVVGRDGSSIWLSWERFRIETIADVVAEVRVAMEAATNRPVALSAAVIADSVAYPGVRTFAQDYTLLAQHLDAVLPMAYASQENEDAAWVTTIALQASQRVTKSKLLMALGAWQQPGDWVLSPKAFSAQLDAAKMGADGVVFYALPHAARQEGSAFGVDPKIADIIAREASVQPSRNWLEPIKTGGGIPFRLQSDHLLAGLVVGYGLLGVAAATAFGLLQLLDGKPAQRAPEPAMARAFFGEASVADLGVARRCAEIDAMCASHKVTGHVFAEVHSLLGAQTAQRVETMRMQAILSVVDREDGRPVERIIADFQGHPAGPEFARTYIEEAILYGFVTIEGGVLRLTERGRETLGHSPHDPIRFAFVERRLQERLLVACPKCGGLNVAQWRQARLTCRGCHEKFAAEVAEEITVRAPTSGGKMLFV
jgi:hypothetical protein